MSAEMRLKARQLTGGKILNPLRFIMVQLLLVAFLNFAVVFINGYFNSQNLYVLFSKIAIAIVLFVLCYLMLSFLSLSADAYYIKSTFEKTKISSVLRHFSKPKISLGALKVKICVDLLRLVFFIICFMPSALMIIFTVYFFKNGISEYNAFIMLVSTAVMFFCSGLYYFKLSRLLFLSRYLYVISSGYKTKEYIKRSINLMKNKTRQLFSIRLSFIGWFFSSIFIITIPYIYGYYKQTMAVTAKEIILKAVETEKQ